MPILKHKINDTFPPMLLRHGKIEPVVPVQQSAEDYEKFDTKPKEIYITLEILENAGHADSSLEITENLERKFKLV